MKVIYFSFLGFVCLIIFAIWYDKIMAHISNPLQLFGGLFFVCMACFTFLEEPELQLSNRYGVPIHNYAWGILFLLLGIMLFGGSIKKNNVTLKKKGIEGSKKKTQ